MPPSTKNDGPSRIEFSEGMRPSIAKLDVVPETREERARRFTLRAIVIAIVVAALVTAIVVWRNWSNAENRAAAIANFDATCDVQSGEQAVELLEAHGEPASAFVAARIRMERAFEEVRTKDAPAEPFDVNGAPASARVDAAIAETYRLLVHNERAAAAQMISAVRVNSQAALRARTRAAVALGQYKYAADTLAQVPAASESLPLAEMRNLVAAMVDGAPGAKQEGAYALTGALRGALAKGHQDNVKAVVGKLAKVATTTRQKRWVLLGNGYLEAHAQGASADLARLEASRRGRLPWSDVYTLALSEMLLAAERPSESLVEQAKLPESARAWVTHARLLRARVHANLMLGYLAKAEAELEQLGATPLEHVLRGWVSMARGRTQAAERHFGLVGESDVFAANLAKLKLCDIAIVANAREQAEKHLAEVRTNEPRWKSEVALRRALLAEPTLRSRFAPPAQEAKWGPDPSARVWNADKAAPQAAQSVYSEALKRVSYLPGAHAGLFEINILENKATEAQAKKLRFDSAFAPRMAQAQALFWLQQGEGSRGASKLWNLIARYNMAEWGALRYLRARLYAQSGEYVRAVREYAKAASLLEAHLNAWVQVMAHKSIAHAELGAKGPAERVLEEIEKRVAEVGRDTIDEQAEALWTAARARQSLVDKKYVAAQMYAKRALKADPALVEAHMVLVDFAISKKREDLDALRAAASGPWPSLRAKRMLNERDETN